MIMTGDWPEANPNTEARAPCPGGQRGEVSYYLYLRYIYTISNYLHNYIYCEIA